MREGILHLLLANNAAADPVDPAVIALSHCRVNTESRCAVSFTLPKYMIRHCIPDPSYIQRVGKGNGRFQSSQLLNLHQAGAFSKSVVHIGSRCICV